MQEEYENPDKPIPGAVGYLNTTEPAPASYFYRGGQGNYCGSPSVFNPFQRPPVCSESRRDIMPPQQPQQQYGLNSFIENSNPYGNRWDPPMNPPYGSDRMFDRGYYGTYQALSTDMTSAITPFSRKDIWEEPMREQVYRPYQTNINWDARNNETSYQSYQGYGPYGYTKPNESLFENDSLDSYESKAKSLFNL